MRTAGGWISRRPCADISALYAGCPVTAASDTKVDPEIPADPFEQKHREATEALQRLPELLAELREYASYYVATRQALWSARLRNIVLGSVLGVTFGVIGAAAVVTAVVLTMLGLAQGVAALAGGRPWVGNLVVGGGLLILSVALTVWLLKSARNSGLRKTMQALERRKALQRQRFDRSVLDRSQAVPSGLADPDGKSKKTA